VFEINKYILSITGGSLIISIFEIVAPIGKMGEFCKIVFNMFYIYILIIPILNLIKNIV